ncbi:MULTISPECIES: DMT family transporter [unclassified Streptomyces]|uniref:DMT family transporter n=1 Tax=unclassified Streptomyces TaxID=2593676 RepID=UPI001BE9BB29|nr:MULTISPECIES: DMT family transporter [unclassified Streptomyces]MBT2404879.1 DMT family transporter [Streptomyces sp. ISL-21]MBT2456276.1 DMT family transporter [Streptomyces sp. ISL-86]
MDRVRTVSQAPQLSSSTGAGAGKKGAAGLGLLLALVATVVWSGSFVATRGMAETVPPVQAVFWRWIIAALAVAPFAARQAWRQRALIRRHLGYIALASLFGVALYNTLVHQAGLTTSASNMGMIMAASPVIMALYARLGGERLGARRTFGMLLAALGVLLLVGDGSLGFDFAAGDLWMFAAALSFATYSALLKRKPAELGGLAFLLTTFVLGALMLAPAYAVSVTVQGGFEVTAATAGPLLYVGIFSSAVAFFAWNKAISVIGAARAGVVYYLQPVCVAGLGFLLLGERTGPAQLLCMALILGGVGLGAGARR